MRNMCLSAAVLVATAVAAWPPIARAQPKPEDPNTPGRHPDATFVESAYRLHRMLASMGKVARERTQDDSVKALGQMLITHHEAFAGEATELARRKRVALPDELDEEDRKKLEAMKELPRKEFDGRFVAEAVRELEAGVTRFKAAAETAKDSDVKRFARGAFPRLEENLREAKALQGRIKEPPSERPEATRT